MNQMNQKILTTHSMWQLFRNCRKKCDYRYFQHLVPLGKNKNLHFGGVIHDCLEIWHTTYDIQKVFDYINRVYVNRTQDDYQLSNWHNATAMMIAYSEYYELEQWETVCAEKIFDAPIVNPDTGKISEKFQMGGKFDLLVKEIVKVKPHYFLCEHKTASNIDSAYLERLWLDPQIILYALYLERILKIKISGIIYNILKKPQIKQHEGETEFEFEKRRDGLIAKSKTGKSSAKRKMPETNDEFQGRLIKKYMEPGMFHRELIYISDQYERFQRDLWDLTGQLSLAMKDNIFYRNPDFCFHYGSPCQYLELCRSNDNQMVVENFYEISPPHQELKDSENIKNIEII
jgi:hypothetical protein